MERENMTELLYQALETERGGVEVYDAALSCVVNADLKGEWGRYREQTKRRVEILTGVLDAFQLEPERRTRGMEIVAQKAQALVKAMEKAREDLEPAGAQLAAAECVVDAETKDHLDWELLGEAAKKLEGEEADVLRKAVDEVENEEDEHLYRTMDWSRELWMEFLGLPAALPPPGENQRAVTANAAARAKLRRGTIMGRRRHASGKRRAAKA